MKENSLNYKNFLDTSKTISKEVFAEVFYAWEVLPLIKDFIKTLGASLPKDKFEKVGSDIWIAKNAKIDSSAHVDGPTIIDENAEIRHCAFIRGSAVVGKNAVVGNSTELKNCILFDNVQVPHFNYVGDSILGYKSHLGAGAIISNVKSDKLNVVIKYKDKKIETGLRKFGAILGDYVEVGCNSVMNPGTLIGRNSSVYPTSMVRGVLDESVIFKNSGNIVKKI